MTLLLKYDAITIGEEDERVKGIVVMFFIGTQRCAVRPVIGEIGNDGH